MEVARCLTGWTINDGMPKKRRGKFLFKESFHDYDAKKLLGNTIPAGGGIVDGESVLDILVEHPNTAEFIARKLLRYFWGYEPKGSMVRKVKRAYLQTGGDIRAMLRIVLSQPLMRAATPKFKRPYHLIVSAIRAMEVSEVDRKAHLMWTPETFGHRLFDFDTPDGYPDRLEYWSGSLLSRWNLGRVLADPGIDIDLPFFVDPPASDAELVDQIGQQFLAGGLSPQTRQVILDYLSATGNGGPAWVRPHGAMSLAMSSPEFQWY